MGPLGGGSRLWGIGTVLCVAPPGTRAGWGWRRSGTPDRQEVPPSLWDEHGCQGWGGLGGGVPGRMRAAGWG